MSGLSLPEGAWLASAQLQSDEWKQKLPLSRTTKGKATLAFAMPGRTDPFVVEDVYRRLGSGAFKIAYGLDNFPLVLKVIPNTGMNKHGWMTSNDPLQELRQATSARAVPQLAPHMPKYYGGLYLRGDQDYGPSPLL